MISQIPFAPTVGRITERTAAREHGDEAAQPFRPMVLACAVLVSFIGAAVLAGWLTGNELLMTVLPGHVRMKPNTAVSFIVCAVSLSTALHVSPAARRLSQWAAVVVLGCGVLTMMEYVARVDLHIDELWFRDPLRGAFPGRMALISAINFSLAGLSLLLLRRGRVAQRLSQLVALALATIAFAAIIGYLYGTSILYGAVGYTAMALHTGVGFLILGAGLLLAPPNSLLGGLLGASERGSWLARRILPAALVLPAVLGWLYLRPALSFGNSAFGMALFAVTMAGAGTAMLWLLAIFLNREERQLAELVHVREQSAAAIRQSEHELRLITDHLPTLLSYIDPDGRFIRVNQTYEIWMGLPAEEIVGQTVAELLGETYWATTKPARARVLRGEMVTFETDYPTIHGERHAQITYAPDMDEDGSLRGIACLVLDVHERRQAEAALRRSEKLAAVGRLASSIAHEINNPLEAVTNLLYLAEQDTAEQRNPAEYIVQAQQELARVTHIVTQTLRFHRQATGATLCTLSDLVGQVLTLYQGRLAQANITVERRFRDTAPLLCRDGEIRQTIANLVGNAADAMSGGGRMLVRTAIATDPHTGQPGVRVTIADTGHGIPETSRRTLFEPFHTTKGAKGSGLGLWISKEIVDRHRGRLRVRSSVQPGRSGTVFSIFLSNLPPEARTL